MRYLLLYEVAPDYLERRGAFRAEHLALAWESARRGELILGGALADPVSRISQRVKRAPSLSFR